MPGRGSPESGSLIGAKNSCRKEQELRLRGRAKTQGEAWHCGIRGLGFSADAVNHWKGLGHR